MLAVRKAWWNTGFSHVPVTEGLTEDETCDSTMPCFSTELAQRNWLEPVWKPLLPESDGAEPGWWSPKDCADRRYENVGLN
jgi:hypothetical protein